MKLVSFFLLPVFLIVIAFSCLFVFSQKKFVFDEQVEINAEAEEVYNYLKFFSNIPQFNDWFEQNPNFNLELIGEDGQVGTTCIWTSTNSSLKSGNIQMKSIKFPNRIEYIINSEQTDFSKARIVYNIKQGNNSTILSWTTYIYLPFPLNIYQLFTPFEKDIQKTIKSSCENLKNILEK